MPTTRTALSLNVELFTHSSLLSKSISRFSRPTTPPRFSREEKRWQKPNPTKALAVTVVTSGGGDERNTSLTFISTRTWLGLHASEWTVMEVGERVRTPSGFTVGWVHSRFHSVLTETLEVCFLKKTDPIFPHFSPCRWLCTDIEKEHFHGNRQSVICCRRKLHAGMSIRTWSVSKSKSLLGAAVRGKTFLLFLNNSTWLWLVKMSILCVTVFICGMFSFFGRSWAKGAVSVCGSPT